MTIEQAIAIAESTDIPQFHREDFVDFESPDGWIVSVFYDCGEFNYVEYFKSPDGTVFDVWDENDENYIQGNTEDGILNELQNWWPKEMTEAYKKKRKRWANEK